MVCCLKTSWVLQPFTIYFIIGIINNVSCNRNVLFVMIDDLRPELAVYNNKTITPNIDILSKEAVVFKNAYSQQALCAPSRNSLLTSRRPDTLHFYDFYSYWRDFAGNFTTLPQFLKQAGYETVSIGKIFHPGVSSNFTDDSKYSWSSTPWHPPTEEFKDDPVCFDDGDWHSNIICPVHLPDQPGGTLPDIESTNAAISYLKKKSNTSLPFFLAVGYHKPHVPFKFPKEFLDLYPLENIDLPDLRTVPPGMPEVAWNPFNDVRERDDIARLNLTYPYGIMPDIWIKKMRQAYYASVSYVDREIGRLFHALRESNLEENTIIVLLGDHGWSLGEHGEWAKFSNFEVAVRAPLIVKVPNLTKGRIVEDIVELLDVFPTLTEVLNLGTVPQCSSNSSKVEFCTEGLSFLPVLMGKIGKKEKAFSQYPRPGLKPTLNPNSDRPKLSEIQVMGYSVRTRRYRYTAWVSWNTQSLSANWSQIHAAELYNHEKDPEENLNLAGSNGMEEVEKQLLLNLKSNFK